MDGPEFVVVPKVVKPKSKGQKILTAVFVSLGLAALLGGTYSSLIYFVLLDFQNMPYLEFSYRSDLEDESQITVTIDKVYSDSDYPAKFRIPNKLLGYPVTAIGDSAFAGLKRLEEVQFPSTIASIGQYAFSNCENLLTFNIPSDLDYIGTDAFQGTAFLLNRPDGPVEIGSILYTYNGYLPNDTAVVKSEESPAIALHDNYFNLGEYVQIGAGAFRDQDGIVYVEFPDSIDTIANYLFQDCDSLSELHLGADVAYIGNYAFDGCSSLTTLKWSDQIETIGSYAFQGTHFTGEVAFGANVSSIGEGAFQNCSEITKITIPSAITAIENYVFDGCSSLSDIIFPAMEHSPNSKIISFGIAAFRATAISEFTIPFSVRNLQESTFENCDNLVSVFAYDNTEGTTRTEYVLDEDTGEMVAVPVLHGLTKMTTKIFYDSSAFKELVLVDKDNIVTSPRNRVTLPSTLAQLGEQNVESYVFAQTAIEVLDLTSAIRFIAPSLATNSPLLREVIIGAEATMLTAIYKDAFLNCIALEEFVMPDTVRSANSSVFEGCTSLTSVTLSTHASFNTIDTNFFRGCTSLTNIIIPSNIRAIKDRAFESCTSLLAITIPSSVISMSANVFNACNPALQITVMTTPGMPNNTANWNANWLGSPLTVEANVTYIVDEE